MKSLIRETKEELGICIGEREPVLLGKFWRHEKYRENFVENELDYIYLLFKDVSLDKIKIQEAEVERVDWIDISKFRNMIKNKTAVQRREVWDALFKYLEALNKH